MEGARMPIATMSDCKLQNKRVLIREDFNVPIKQGVVSSDLRIRAALPTIKAALKANAKVMLMSHLGRPLEERYDEAYSLAPVAKVLSLLLQMEVPLIQGWVEGLPEGEAQVGLFEKQRFFIVQTRPLY